VQNEAAITNLILTAEDACDSLGVCYVFLDQNSLGEGVCVVRIKHRDGALQNDRAVVQFFIHKMNRASGDLCPVVQGLLVRIQTWKGGEQRGMNVQDAIRKGSNELRRDEPHVAREADQIHLMGLETGNDVSVVFGSFASGGDKERVAQSELLGSGQARCLGNIRDHHGNDGVRKMARANGLRDSEKV